MSYILKLNWVLFLVSFIQVILIFLLLAYYSQAFAWNVPFDPQAPEVAAGAKSADMLSFINIFINWTCAVLSVYIGYKAASRLHNSDYKGFFQAMTASFIIGGAPYFSQFLIFH